MELTPQFVSALSVLLVGAVAFWAIFWDYRKRRLVYEERRLMIERGLTPPATFSPWGGWPAVKQHEQQLLYEERRLRIEKGLPVPPLPEPKPWTSDDYLRWGIVMLCLGAGGVIAYVMISTSPLDEAAYARAWAAGLSPLLAGLGLGLIVWARAAKKRRPE
jgi:hypothetical protein